MEASEDGDWITYNSGYGSSRFYYVSYCAPIEYAISHSVTDRYSEVLAAVGTYNDFDSQEITIEVYDSSFTKQLYSQKATLNYHGYHTIVLDEPLGQSFVKLDEWKDLTGEDIESELGTDYKPGNCCIKALYQ